MNLRFSSVTIMSEGSMLASRVMDPHRAGGAAVWLHFGVLESQRCGLAPAFDVRRVCR